MSAYINVKLTDMRYLVYSSPEHVNTANYRLPVFCRRPCYAPFCTNTVARTDTELAAGCPVRVNSSPSPSVQHVSRVSRHRLMSSPLPRRQGDAAAAAEGRTCSLRARVAEFSVTYEDRRGAWPTRHQALLRPDSFEYKSTN